MLAFKDALKTIQQIQKQPNVFADIIENGHPYILDVQAKIITKGCNSFTGDYGTQHSIGLVLEPHNDLEFLFAPIKSLKRECDGWKRKPVFKGNDGSVLFVKVKEPIEVLQGQQVHVTMSVGIHFCPADKVYGLYFKNVIVE